MTEVWLQLKHTLCLTSQQQQGFEEPSGHNTLDPPRTLQLPNPEYVLYTDSELEHVRKAYFDLQRTGQERGCRLSKELRCRLVRNTVTNMVSIMRASSTDYMYPSKNDILAMAKRLVEYYPMLRDDCVNCKHSSVRACLRACDCLCV